MIDHLTIKVSDLAKSHAFYTPVLATLEMKENLGSADEGYYGFGEDDAPEFEIAGGRVFLAQREQNETPPPAFHIAFRAPSKEVVHAFYEAAIAAGAHDNGPPGPRPHYTENYYAAFVLDPDGNNIEVVAFL